MAYAQVQCGHSLMNIYSYLPPSYSSPFHKATCYSVQPTSPVPPTDLASPATLLERSAHAHPVPAPMVTESRSYISSSYPCCRLCSFARADSMTVSRCEGYPCETSACHTHYQQERCCAELGTACIEVVLCTAFLVWVGASRWGRDQAGRVV